MKKATRPCEVIYMDYIPFPTINDGMCYTFIAVDEYSEFSFMLGTTKEVSDQIYLQQVVNLMNNKDFRMHDVPFELVLDFGKWLRDDIKAIIKPYDGQLTFSTNRVEKALKPVLISLQEFNNKQN